MSFWFSFICLRIPLCIREETARCVSVGSVHPEVRLCESKLLDLLVRGLDEMFEPSITNLGWKELFRTTMTCTDQSTPWAKYQPRHIVYLILGSVQVLNVHIPIAAKSKIRSNYLGNCIVSLAIVAYCSWSDFYRLLGTWASPVLKHARFILKLWYCEPRSDTSTWTYVTITCYTWTRVWRIIFESSMVEIWMIMGHHWCLG